MIHNDREFEATQYRLTQFEKVVCGLRHEGANLYLGRAVYGTKRCDGRT